jgi:hypothetical protein
MVMVATQMGISWMLLLEVNGGKSNKGTWVYCWINEVGRKGEGAWMGGCWAEKQKMMVYPFVKIKKKELGGYPMEVECIKGCFGVWKWTFKV